MKQFTIGKKKFILQNPYIYAFFISLMFAIMCLISFFRLSILSSFSPIAYTSEKDIDNYYDEGINYTHCTIDTLYYTGYDVVSNNKVTGHYYYTLLNDRCTIYILSSKHVGNSSNPPIVLNNQTFNATLRKNDNNFKSLLEYMSADLNWNYSGMLRHTSTTIIDQKSYSISTYILISIFTFTSVVLTLITAILAWHHSDYISKPHHSQKTD